jgi:hypothetical protein
MTAALPFEWPEDAPADRRHSRLREILMQQGAAGASVAKLHAWLSAEGLNVARETLFRWLVLDEAAGLAVRSGSRHATTWHWSSPA